MGEGYLGLVERMGEMRNVYKIMVIKAEVLSRNGRVTLK
jgi:hypothetical protein